MAGPRTSRKPTFFWQGMLILLPVAVLVAIGWASLRQDKLLAEHDARERAQTIAEDFLKKFAAELTATGSRTNAAFSFVVDPAGGLIFPPAWNPLPTPQPLNLSQLDGRQTRLWQKVRETISDGTNGAAATDAVNHFIASGPPENFAAAACYDLGLQLARRKQIEAAMGMFDLLLGKFPDAVGESGLSFQPLAQFRLLELERDLTNQSGYLIALDSFYSNVVWHPGPLTPYFLGCGPESETISKWQRIWNEHQTGRELFSAAGKFVPTNANSAFGQLLFHPTPESKAEKIPVPAHGLKSVLVQNADAGGSPSLQVPSCRRRARNNPGSPSVSMNHRPLNGLSATANPIWASASRTWRPAKNTCPNILASASKWPEGKSGNSHRISTCGPFPYRAGGKAGGGEVKGPLDVLATNVLASAVQPEQLLKVNVYLTSPDKLYQRQGARASGSARSWPSRRRPP